MCFVLTILLLVGAYFYARHKGIKIPFIGKPPVREPDDGDKNAN